jgi:hypothetical protein
LTDNFEHNRYRVEKKCEISQIQHKSPEKEIVIVSKTLKGREREHSEWEERAAEAQRVVNRLPHHELIQCLGQKKEDEIMALHMVRLETTDPSTERTDTEAGASSTVPQKRSWME